MTKDYSYWPWCIKGTATSFGQGIVSSFGTQWPEWSWIVIPDLDNPKETCSLEVGQYAIMLPS